MQLKHCGRCGEDKPESDWNRSQWARSGTWCIACYRDWHRNRYTPKNEADDAPRNCAQCGASYRPGARRPSMYCSGKCKDDARNAATRAARLAAKATPRHCMQCGDELPPQKRSDAIFCSAECNSAAHSLQRKLRTRTGEAAKPGYLRAFICERDKWRCQICRKKVNRQLRHPHPLCASLDHLIPVCEGGTSDVWNLRLTHLRCNLQRNAARKEQMPLF